MTVIKIALLDELNQRPLTYHLHKRIAIKQNQDTNVSLKGICESGSRRKGSAEYIHQALSVDVYSCENLAYSMEFHLKVFVNFLLLFSSLVCRPETLGTSLYLTRHLEYGDFCGDFSPTAWLPFDGAHTYRSFWNVT